MRLIALALAATLLTHARAHACEIDTPSAQLPGFTKEQVEQREREILSAWSILRTNDRVEALLKEAKLVYLAQIVRSDQNVETLHFETEIAPLKAIKGKLPMPRKLAGSMPSSCGDPYGDGDGSYANVGELVVVFEGVKIRDDRPRGVDSVRMIEVVSGSLLDPVQEWLSSQPDPTPPG